MFKHTSLFTTVIALFIIQNGSAQPIPMTALSAENLGIAWGIITEAIKMWSTQSKEAPIPYMTFYNNLSNRYQRLPVIWNKDNVENPSDLTCTPLQDLKSSIPDLLIGYPNKINPQDCNLFYEHLGSDIPINSDQIIANMLELPPDFKNKYRQVFVRCKGIPGKCGGGQNNANTCDTGETKSEQQGSSTNIQYELALDAYRHGKAHQMARSPAKIEEFEEELEDWGMDEFEIKSDALQMIWQNKASFKKDLTEMATAFDWNEKMQKAINAAINAKAAFHSDRDVKFDKATWTLTAFVARFASFLDESGDKISYTITTSNFRFKVPESEREESMIQKYLTKSGTVSKKFIRRITFLIEAEAAKTGQESLYLPKEYQYPANATE
eukprot:28418_1